MLKKIIFVTISLFSTLVLISCLKDGKTPTSPSEEIKSGQVFLRISDSAGSLFHKISRRATLTITANNMAKMTRNLSITDSSVEGLILGIPSGKARTFEVLVYDSADVVNYKGKATADIAADSTTKLAINIYRILGNVNLVGQVIDSPNNSLIAYYPFSGNANDASGNGFNGELHNGPALAADRWGRPNNAYGFDGQDDFIKANIGKQNKLSVSLWYKSNDPIQNYPLLFMVDTIQFIVMAGNNGAYIADNNVGHISSFPNMIRTLPFVPSLNAWHHVAVTYNPGKNLHQVFIDGTLRASGTTAPEILSPRGNIYIGNNTTGKSSDGGAGFYGSIDDIRVYNIALDSSQINALYLETP